MNPEKFTQAQSFSSKSEKESQETKISHIPKRESNYEIFKNPEGRHFLLEVADNFIDQIRKQENPYDAFVFLDRGHAFLAI